MVKVFEWYNTYDHEKNIKINILTNDPKNIDDVYYFAVQFNNNLTSNNQ